MQVNRDIFKGHCTIRHKEISVAHGRKADVHHSVSAGHERAEAAASATAISTFFVRSAPRSTVDQQVIRSDLLIVTTMSSDRRLVYVGQAFCDAWKALNFVFGRGSAPDPAGGAHDAPPDLLVARGHSPPLGSASRTPFRPCVPIS